MSHPLIWGAGPASEVALDAAPLCDHLHGVIIWGGALRADRGDDDLDVLTGRWFAIAHRAVSGLCSNPWSTQAPLAPPAPGGAEVSVSLGPLWAYGVRRCIVAVP